MTFQVNTVEDSHGRSVFYLAAMIHGRVVMSTVVRGKLTEHHINRLKSDYRPYKKIGLWKQLAMRFSA